MSHGFVFFTVGQFNLIVERVDVVSVSLQCLEVLEQDLFLRVSFFKES